MAIMHHGRHRRHVTWAMRAARWVEVWRRFWWESAPDPDPAHEPGATGRWAADLSAMDAELAAVRDYVGDEPGLYRLLTTATVICGDPELTTVDGWSLRGSLYDQLPGA